MEENLIDEQFGSEQIGLDSLAIIHLGSIVKWSKFLSIFGFVIIGLIALVGIGMLFGAGTALGLGSEGIWLAVLYLLIMVFYIYPTYNLFKFSSHGRTAIDNNDSQGITLAFEHLKKTFAFFGYLMVIMLAIYALAIVAGVLGAAFS